MPIDQGSGSGVSRGGVVHLGGSSSTAVNSFGTFLDTVQRGAPPDQNDQDLESRVLAILADEGRKSIADLVSATQVKLSAVLQVLRVLRDFGLVTLVGEPGDEMVEATRSGARTAIAIR